LETIWRETLASFEWLARDVDRDREVSFVPNPGNIGDALINVSCYRYLTVRFRKITVSSWREAPANKHVFIAGGGNLVEGLYNNMARLLGGLDRGQQLYLFPSTVSGYEALLGQLRGRTRMLTRERVSFRHVREHLGEADTALGHDAAFALADRLQAAFRIAIHQVPPQKTARFYRKDKEGKIAEPGDGDLTARADSDWTDPAEAEKAVLAIVPEILACSRIYTDRLHCAILSALLGRYVVLRPNSYFKNQEVFDHSLSRFANVRFHAEGLDA
jgi:exopolysaccharide biosynthesis predicted pyruvyltransferase EpsI